MSGPRYHAHDDHDTSVCCVEEDEHHEIANTANSGASARAIAACLDLLRDLTDAQVRALADPVRRQPLLVLARAAEEAAFAAAPLASFCGWCGSHLSAPEAASYSLLCRSCGGDAEPRVLPVGSAAELAAHDEASMRTLALAIATSFDDVILALGLPNGASAPAVISEIARLQRIEVWARKFRTAETADGLGGEP